MNKILLNNELKKCVLLGGVRGDDPLGVHILTHYFKNSSPVFQLLLGNFQAIEKKVPFVNFDLVQAGLGDATCTTSVEECRAGELHQVISQYDFAVDIYGSQANEDLLVITNDDPQTLALAGAFKISRVVLVPPGKYLLGSVKHAVTLIKRLADKSAPTTEELAQTLRYCDNVEKYFTLGGQVNSQLDIKKLDIGEVSSVGDLIDYPVNLS